MPSVWYISASTALCGARASGASPRSTRRPGSWWTSTTTHPPQRLGISRRELLERTERQALHALPAEPFALKDIQMATVGANYHVELREDRHYYSVPHYLRTKEPLTEVKIVYDERVVSIYHEHLRITQHVRDRSPNVPQVLPEGFLGKAISYAVRQWERMIRYLDDGILRPDSNLAENAIRPFCVGRKNWLFAGSPRGAFASARILTLIESARANGLEPYHYLHHVFLNLPGVVTERELLALLPTNLTPAQIAPKA